MQISANKKKILRWGTWCADVLHVRTGTYALACGCVVCGRVGSLMCCLQMRMSVDKNEKYLLGMVDASRGCVACIHVSMTYLCRCRSQ